MKPLVLAMPGNEAFASSLLRELDAELGVLALRRFPDEESYVRIDSNVAGREVILLATLDRPDAKLLPLLFSAQTARELGAVQVGLVAPYLAYMRQDRQFQPGEAVTSRHFAKLISLFTDWLVTVDPHLHRLTSLGEIYSVRTRVVHAAASISRWLSELEAPVLIGPDGESEQWVAAVARDAHVPYLVLRKTRRGDRDVEASIPDVERYLGRTPVLVDDIISTARTMIQTVGHLKRAGLPPPVCIGVHAVFAGDAYADLKRAGRRGSSPAIRSRTNRTQSTWLRLSPLRRKSYPPARCGATRTGEQRLLSLVRASIIVPRGCAASATHYRMRHVWSR